MTRKQLSIAVSKNVEGIKPITTHFNVFIKVLDSEMLNNLDISSTKLR